MPACTLQLKHSSNPIPGLVMISLRTLSLTWITCPIRSGRQPSSMSSSSSLAEHAASAKCSVMPNPETSLASSKIWPSAGLTGTAGSPQRSMPTTPRRRNCFARPTMREACVGVWRRSIYTSNPSTPSTPHRSLPRQHQIHTPTHIHFRGNIKE